MFEASYNDVGIDCAHDWTLADSFPFVFSCAEVVKVFVCYLFRNVQFADTYSSVTSTESERDRYR